MGLRVFAIDWSGVVSDDRRPVHYAANKLLTLFGRPPVPFQQFLRYSGNSIVSFCHNNGVEVPEESVRMLFREYYEEAEALGLNATLLPGVAETISRLGDAGLRPVVISAHPSDFVRREAVRYGLEGRLTYLVGNGVPKSSSLAALAQFRRVAPAECAYVGDMTFDVLAAREAGVLPLAVTTGYHARDQLEAVKPAAVMNNLTELPDVLRSLFPKP